MANRNLMAFLQGGLGTLTQRAQQGQQQQQEIQSLILKAMIEQKMKQQDPYNQLQTLMLQKYAPELFGQSGGQIPTGQAPTLNLQGQGQGIGQSQPNMPQYRMKPSFTFGKEGLSIGLSQEETPEYKLQQTKAEQELKATVPTVQQKNDLNAARQQLTNVQQLQNLANGVPAGRIAGLGSMALNTVTGGGMAQNTRLYLKQLPAMAVSLYRALTGDTRLSDADAASRAMPLLWHPSEAGNIRKASFDNIKKALLRRIKMLESKQGLVPNPLAPDEFITPLETIIENNNINKNDSMSIENLGLDPSRYELIGAE